MNDPDFNHLYVWVIDHEQDKKIKRKWVNKRTQDIKSMLDEYPPISSEDQWSRNRQESNKKPLPKNIDKEYCDQLQHKMHDATGESSCAYTKKITRGIAKQENWPHEDFNNSDNVKIVLSRKILDKLLKDKLSFHVEKIDINFKKFNRFLKKKTSYDTCIQHITELDELKNYIETHIFNHDNIFLFNQIYLCYKQREDYYLNCARNQSHDLPMLDYLDYTDYISRNLKITFKKLEEINKLLDLYRKVCEDLHNTQEQLKMEREAQSHQREIKRLYGKCKLEGIPTIEEFNEFQFQNTDDKTNMVKNIIKIIELNLIGIEDDVCLQELKEKYNKKLKKKKKKKRKKKEKDTETIFLNQQMNKVSNERQEIDKIEQKIYEDLNKDYSKLPDIQSTIKNLLQLPFKNIYDKLNQNITNLRKKIAPHSSTNEGILYDIKSHMYLLEQLTLMQNILNKQKITQQDKDDIDNFLFLNEEDDDEDPNYRWYANQYVTMDNLGTLGTIFKQFSKKLVEKYHNN